MTTSSLSALPTSNWRNQISYDVGLLSLQLGSMVSVVYFSVPIFF